MYEWDEEKKAANIEKHGMCFEESLQIFDGRPSFTYRSARNGELRHATVGSVDERLWVVVWTKRGNDKRIISVHRADNAEIRKYSALFGL
jgi:uncharacterized DUF497 family protein